MTLSGMMSLWSNNLLSKKNTVNYLEDLIEDKAAYFAAFVKQKDADIDLGQTAIMLAGEQHPDLRLESYFNHLNKLEAEVFNCHKTYLSENAKDDVDTQMAALKKVIYDDFGYQGNTQNYDHIDNADLIRVIDERKGLPVALGIIWITLARRLGWIAEGLNFPGHFYCRLTKDGQQRIIDPFEEGRPVGAADMREKLKQLRGEHAELSSTYHQGVKNKDILIRLQNNIKIRQVSAEDFEGALKTVERMQLIDPKEPRLFFDSGILYAKLEQPKAAVAALETYLSFDTLSALDKEEAHTLIAQIRSILQ